MPIFDTPITTDEASLERVLAQSLPVVLYLFSKPDPALDTAFKTAAKNHAGDLLVVRVDASSSPKIYDRFGRPSLPALLTLDEGEIESRAAQIRPSDVDDHVAFLLGEGPLPTETAAQAEARAQSGTAPVHVSDRSFAADVLQSDVPVLVDFWAPWCGPCHMIAPILDRLAEQYAGQVRIAKLNVDENPITARQFQAMSIPMLLLFHQGKVVNRLVGAQPQPNIEQMIRAVL